MSGLGHFAMTCVVGGMATACGGSSTNPAGPTTSAATVATVVVTSAPAPGSSLQMTATARLSDGTSRDVTGAAAWESSNRAVATVSPTGMVAVVSAGELDVRATYQTVTGLMHLLVATVAIVAVTIGDAPTASSMSFQLTAMARLGDGSTQDVTRSASWRSSNPQLAAVSSSGFVTVLGTGDVDLQATYQRWWGPPASSSTCRPRSR
jgi:uncharacterized protein YjdB